MFRVVLDRSAYKNLESFPRDVQKRVYARLKLVEESPFQYVEHFEGACYKLRIGDYRALLEIKTAEKIIFVRVLDKRERVYR
jgi:mRNA-degrading endonuclease RelE of RelBE toxin-antitoxin system